MTNKRFEFLLIQMSESQLPSHDLVEHNPERVDIDLLVAISLLIPSFGGCVKWRCLRMANQCGFMRTVLNGTKVTQMRMMILVNKDVPWFQISMDNTS